MIFRPAYLPPVAAALLLAALSTPVPAMAAGQPVAVAPIPPAAPAMPPPAKKPAPPAAQNGPTPLPKQAEKSAAPPRRTDEPVSKRPHRVVHARHEHAARREESRTETTRREVYRERRRYIRRPPPRYYAYSYPAPEMPPPRWDYRWEMVNGPRWRPPPPWYRPFPPPW